MDINARINWRPGMELTTQTFLDMDENLDFRQQMAIRAALGDHCIGLLPDTTFNNSAMFYTNHFEMERLQCTALLPSGRIIQVFCLMPVFLEQVRVSRDVQIRI